MTLPGKITFCQLEEDNPQKSYFRIRPLFTFEDGALSPISDAKELYPDEGGIRIVPDKNEALRFKTRMRTLGGYCLLDLIRHTGENDKIRSNKNYSPEKGEFNRNIVYSDVITACPDSQIMEVVDPDNGPGGVAAMRAGENVYTHKVLFQEEGRLRGPFVPEMSQELGAIAFTPDESCPPMELPDENVHVFTRDGREVKIWISPEFIAACAEMKPVEKETAPAEENASAPEKPDAEASSREVSLPNPVKDTDQAADGTEKAQEKPEVRNCRRPETPKDRCHEEKRCDDRRNSRVGVFDGQLGLNPRRSRSLSEIVDEGWRHSRIEQLGAAIPGQETGRPVVSPIDRAKQALEEAWKLREGRPALIQKLMQLDELPESMGAAAKAPSGQKEAGEALNDLEAERLHLLREIDTLKNNRLQMRGEIMEETRAAHQEEIRGLEEEKQRLKQECESRLRAAESARQTQAEAEHLLSSESKALLDNEFLKYVMFTRAAQMLTMDERIDSDVYHGVPEVYEPTAAQLISDLRCRFEALGRKISHDEALNLLACLALGEIVMFSGPTGVGKTWMADALAGALGLTQTDASRYAHLGAEVGQPLKHPAFRELLRANDRLTPRFVLLDDVNSQPVMDQSRGALSFADQCKKEGFTILMTCLDDQIGYPLQPRLLDRAFFIRLKNDEEGTWLRAQPLPKTDKAPTLESIRRIFNTDAEVPGVILDRFRVLSEKLASEGVRISPRTQGDMYAYCAAVIPLMTGDPIEALDRAVAQRALPHILATAKPALISRLPEILCDMPMSVSLLNDPIALPDV